MSWRSRAMRTTALSLRATTSAGEGVCPTRHTQRLRHRRRRCHRHQPPASPLQTRHPATHSHTHPPHPSPPPHTPSHTHTHTHNQPTPTPHHTHIHAQKGDRIHKETILTKALMSIPLTPHTRAHIGSPSGDSAAEAAARVFLHREGYLPDLCAGIPPSLCVTPQVTTIRGPCLCLQHRYSTDTPCTRFPARGSHVFIEGFPRGFSLR